MAEAKNIMTEIVIDDGSVEVPIKNKQGAQIGVFYFRPTDIGFIDRYNKTVGKFDDIVAPLENVNIKPDGTAEEQEQADADALREAEKRLYEACDYMFDGNMSEAFFGSMNPFSPVGGRFYCEHALEAVGKYISAQFEQETAKIEKRVQRYTHGYSARTGKHKDGKR